MARSDEAKARDNARVRERRKTDPEWAEKERVRLRTKNRRRRADGSLTDGYAAQLLSGGLITHMRSHHAAVRRILGGEPGDGRNVSRQCEDRECPYAYEGHNHSHGQRVPHTLCRLPQHYALESPKVNQERKARAEAARHAGEQHPVDVVKERLDANAQAAREAALAVA